MRDEGSRPTAALLAQVARVVSEAAGADLPVRSIEVLLVDGQYRVDVATSAPVRLIGRRGALAGDIRGQIADVVGTPDVEFNIIEVPDRR